MRRGVELEADAIRAYEASTGLMVRHTGFLAHDTLPIGCSLDGHVGEFVGLIEVKCPKRATHLEYLRTREVPEEYQRQITHNLFVSGAQWADFVSYDDRFPAPLRLLRLRVRREDVDLEAYELILRVFLADIDRECDAILGLIEQAAA
jgi:predicted phage-related endonuclease